jgi:hypothetical protein
MSALSIFALVLVHAARAASPAAPVGPDAVWNPPADFLATFHAACDRHAGAGFGACFVEQMAKAGASPAALAFAKSIDGQGYLRQFADTGLVDVAVAVLPFRANENSVAYLVNGTPPRIDVDDLPKAVRDAVVGNRGYGALLKSHPNLAIFPGPRADANAIRLSPTPREGQMLVVPYTLRDGCHACKVVADMDLRFLFDVEGRFEKIELQRIHKRP